MSAGPDTTPAADKRNGYSLETDLRPILRGDVVLPNLIEMPLTEGVARIAAAAGTVARPDVERTLVHRGRSGQWARYFLNRTQAGAWDGSGYVMWWDNGRGRCGSFAICVHESVLEPGADPRRGWRPSHCRKCGLDTTIDSGD